MHEFGPRFARAALIAAAASLAAGCSGDTTQDSNAGALDSDAMLEQPANDASAMESAYNAAEPAADSTGPGNAANAGNATDGTDAGGETSGGDTGGNTLDSNAAAM